MSQYNRGISTLILKKDIKRGVKFLNEKSYTKYWGSTSNSVNFACYVLNECNVGNITQMEFKLTKRNHYSVILHTDKGYTLLLKGLSYGYYGEGTRGAEFIALCGKFTPKQIKRIYKEKKDFKLVKRVS